MLAPFFTHPWSTTNQIVAHMWSPSTSAQPFHVDRLVLRLSRNFNPILCSEDLHVYGSPGCRLNQLRNRNVLGPFSNKSEIPSQLSQKM